MCVHVVYVCVCVCVIRMRAEKGYQAGKMVVYGGRMGLGSMWDGNGSGLHV